MNSPKHQHDGKQRLFTAIALPARIRAQLLQLRPAVDKRIRRIEAGQMHLTLCFIGQARLQQVDTLLGPLRGRPFDLKVRAVGKFGGSARGALLWAGVEEQPALRQLQADMANALQACLQHPDARPYQPHITLARCRPHLPEALLESFLQQTVAEELCFRVESFGLYSSVTGSSGPIYTCEKTYPLPG